MSSVSAKMGANIKESALIVRVKRRRSQAPSDVLCVVECIEESDSLSRDIQSLQSLNFGESSDLTNNNNHKHKRKYVFLSRVETRTADGSIQIIDNAISSRSEVSGSDIVPLFIPHKKATYISKVGLGQGQKKLSSETSKSQPRGGRSGLLLDMTQVDSNSALESNQNTHTQFMNYGSNNSQSQLQPQLQNQQTTRRVRVLNPATRQLEIAIETAHKAADFSEIAAAITAGADMNHHTSAGGITPLIAASGHCHLRMVTRLLALGVNPGARDFQGRSAMDWARACVVSANKLESKLELVQRLHRAAVRWRNVRFGSIFTNRETQSDECVNGGGINQNGACDDANVDGNDSDEYEYDIFHLSSGPTPPLEDGGYKGPVVPVAGLRLGVVAADRSVGSGEGVELVFDYDSDWSALADDEEEDSNAEDHPGNDYPDEEDEDDFDGRHHSRTQRRFGGECESEDQDSEANRSKAELDDIDDIGIYDDDDGGEWTAMRYRGGGIGRVMKPFEPTDNNEAGSDVLGFGAGHTINRSEVALRHLWGEEEPDEDYEGYGENADGHGDGVDGNFKSEVKLGSGGRIVRGRREADMHRASGMAFASSPREFDRATGLPLRGEKLEDDADDMLVLRSLLASGSREEDSRGGMRTLRPFHNNEKTSIFNRMEHCDDLPDLSTVAYDSELDHSD